MQLYSLEIDDFSSHDYHLIGIHSTLEDYRLAFLLNKYLDVNFKRAHYDLDFKNKNNNSSYSVYEYTNKKLDDDWFLIANVYKSIVKPITKGLFSESETRTYLVPEKKRVDYFLKLEGDLEFEYIIKSIEKINQIPQIITSYIIETNTLKSKDFLIF